MKTAVSWLEEQIVVRRNGLDNSIPLTELFQQAKEMEKQLIYESYDYGFENPNVTGEQYYNETHKSE